MAHHNFVAVEYIFLFFYFFPLAKMPPPAAAAAAAARQHNVFEPKNSKGKKLKTEKKFVLAFSCIQKQTYFI